MGQMLAACCPGFKPGRRLLVMNDEAHHCYLPRAKGRDTEEDNSATENERAAVWFSGLRAMARRWQVRAVYDLSATPYYLAGSGWPAYSYFPWIVSDFSLIEAIEAGLVKIPFLPVDDTAQDIEEPMLRNLYEHCKERLAHAKASAPSASKTAPQARCHGPRRKRPRPAAAAPAARHCCCKARWHSSTTTTEPTSVASVSRASAAATCSAARRCSSWCAATPPSAKRSYKHIAGYETTDDDGEPYAVPGVLPLFSAISTPITRAPRQQARPRC